MKPGLKNIILIAIGSAILFIPFLGGVHLFDWDEINFAEAAREMIMTGQYNRVMINYEVFTEKPPLFFWLQVLSMKLFGINEFAARFPNAIAGIITLCSLYLIGSKMKSRKFGLIWALAYAGSMIPHVYFKSGLIDPVFNLFMFLSLFFGYQALTDRQGVRKNRIDALVGGLFMGLAMLTKGPVGLLLPGLSLFIFWILNRKNHHLKPATAIIFVASVIIIPLLWYGTETIKYGTGFIREFIIRNLELLKNEDAGHGGPFYYHWVVVLFGVFPASVFAIEAFLHKNDGLYAFKKLMTILLLVVLVIFSIVNTKIVHYSSLAYYPVTFLAAWFIFYFFKGTFRFSRFSKTMLLIISSLIFILLIAFPLVMMRSELLIPLLDDPFAQEALKARVNWNFSDLLPGVVFGIGTSLALYFMIFSKRGNQAIILLFTSVILSLQIGMIKFIPKIEKHSQNAMIEFCKSVAEEDCYVYSDFKSYAHFYYADIKPDEKIQKEKSWLETIASGKKVYIIAKIHKAHKYQNDKYKELYRKNGFVFFEQKQD